MGSINMVGHDLNLTTAQSWLEHGLGFEYLINISSLEQAHLLAWLVTKNFYFYFVTTITCNIIDQKNKTSEENSISKQGSRNQKEETPSKDYTQL